MTKRWAGAYDWDPPHSIVTPVETDVWGIAKPPAKHILFRGWKLVRDDGWEYTGYWSSCEAACREAAWLMGWDPDFGLAHIRSWFAQRDPGGQSRARRGRP